MFNLTLFSRKIKKNTWYYLKNEGTFGKCIECRKNDYVFDVDSIGTVIYNKNEKKFIKYIKDFNTNTGTFNFRTFDMFTYYKFVRRISNKNFKEFNKLDMNKWYKIIDITNDNFNLKIVFEDNLSNIKKISIDSFLNFRKYLKSCLLQSTIHQSN